MNRLTLKTAIVAVVIIASLIFLHYVGWLRPVEGLIAKALNPVEEKMRTATLGARSFYDSWLTKRNLLAENTALKTQLLQNQVDASRVMALEEENGLLKQELKFVTERNIKYVSAKIVSGISDPYSQAVVIDRGLEAGLTPGLAVVTGEGIIIGKVVSVSSGYAKVLLLTDNKSKVAATVQNIDRTVGLVEGQFGLSFIMTNIPRDQLVKEGDLIVTSGLEGSVPKNLPIAQVESVKEVESEIFKTAILKPMASFANLSNVLVIIP